MIAVSMLAIYYLYAYLNASEVSLEPVKRKLFTESQMERMDRLQSGLEAVRDTYMLSMSNPWKNILENIDSKLLKKTTKQKSTKQRNIAKRKGQHLLSTSKLSHRSGGLRAKDGWT